ncbi:MAG: hypothetical protein IPM34_12250 [Saprospiraceae bacterium]|nr:hypothetical protein [Saprospiraceae bacterium]
MRSRLVIWGTNKDENRVLLAISLNAEENQVAIWSIPESAITEEFYNLMMSSWREGSDLDLPDGTENRTIELTMAETILPEDLKVEKSDVIQRAQLEWHFIVLSTKLYKNFKTELEDLGDKIKRLEEYSSELWDELKQFWSTVQQHIFDKNILRDHSDSLKEKTNSLFEELKKLRKAQQSVFNQKSKEISTYFTDKLEAITQKIQGGSVLKPQFDELVQLQKELKEKELSRKDKDHILAKINECFKSIREKRETQHQHGTDDSGQQKFSKRFEGLIQAIKRIEQSIEFEEKNIFFENKRIANTDGQLEAQIRVAKIKMIEERLKSKQAKLSELLETKAKLEVLNEKIKKREEKNKKRLERKEQFEEEKEKIKAQIADEIQDSLEKVPEEVQEKLVKAAEEIKSTIKGSRKKDNKKAEASEASEITSSNLPEAFPDDPIIKDQEEE